MNAELIKGYMKRGIAFLLAGGMIFTTLTGCCLHKDIPDNYHRVDKKHEAGSSHVAILGIAPWDTYVEQLSAKFTMDDETALASVLPDTLLFTRKELDSAQLGLKLALPTSGTTSSTTTTLNADGTTSTTGDTTTNKAPGDLSSIQDISPIAGERTAQDVSGTDLDTASIKPDPFLQHQVALALKQEIALLNNQVRDAAIRRGMTPYVVRMQVTLLPNARNEPYDADVYTSFFYGDKQSMNCKSKRFKTPYILPLLAADNLEGALQSRSIDQLRQLSLALAASIQGVGAGFDAQRFNEQFEKSFGRDLNSLMSVARANDNTLRVHLGAQLSPSSRYAMVTRNHYVSFLLLVDQDYEQAMKTTELNPTIGIVARTEFRDAITGVRLPNRTRDESYQELNRILADYGSSFEAKKSFWNSLIAKVQANDFAGFEQELIQEPNIEEWLKYSLWSSLLGVFEGASFKSASFDLPPTRVPSLEEQTILLVDNGKHTTVSLAGKNLNTKKFSASLTVNADILPGKVVTSSGGVLSLQFPSLHAWVLQPGSNEGARACPKGKITIRIKGGDLDWSAPKTGATSGCRYLYKKTKPAKTPVAFTLKSSTGVVVSNKGVGTLKLSVEINKTKEKKPATKYVTITVEGADIDAVTGGTTQTGNRVQVATSGDVTLTLSRLLPGNAVRITAISADKKTSIDPLILPIATP